LALSLAVEQSSLLKFIEFYAHSIGGITKLLGKTAQMTAGVGVGKELEQELKAGLAGD
jgi:hypothetical protein